MFDFEALRKDLHEDEKLGALVICEETETDILTDDFDCHRYINYHLVPPTREWLQSLFYFPQDCKQDKTAFLNRCLDILMAADPNMLINLRHVFFIRTAADIREICSLPDINDELFPDILIDEDDCESPTLSCVGCFWHYESALVINMRAIEHTAEDIDPNDAGIVPEGVYTTLPHELRHLGLENPYLPKDEYPDYLRTEENIEEWGRALYERVTYS